ncbi:SusD/RagB family nutrient-binding outer membrane lipoprotein [Chitinophaga pendula]|uniref:SusD/RagB family nutrient-binding outer membrane lipoprotein n=1 Tax=Chitinophaga TaxID=79328 RepID=UPI0012FD693A|nr:MULTISPECIES: SusD/RagB family nutrient-binding outer membrane lipoprotein [Chitinophaga]UCJ07743.1 SusD/RagB family nutrient-binding outer membrane lipoprotein [Chitinophaga pendula]
MKKQFLKYTFIVSLGVLGALGQGCSKIDKFGDTNFDPNTTPNPVPSALLTSVLSGTGGLVFDGNFYRNTSTQGMYCQYFTQSQYTEEARYAIPDYNWDVFFAGSDADNVGIMPGANLFDLQNIINYVSKPENAATAVLYGSVKNQIAVARILKAYLFWNLTDQYGDMPYKEALKNTDAVPYTEQKDIYPDLLKELKEATAQFDSGEMPQGDIWFNGNKDKWIKFANSLRLLIALRMSKINPATAQTEYNSALSAGVIEDNSQNAKLDYPGGARFMNPFYEFAAVIKRSDVAVTNVVINQLKNTNDRRRAVFGSSEVGFPYGLTREDAVLFSNANPTWARPFAASYRQPTSPMYILTAAHIWLSRAEAANLGWGGDAATAYKNGIEASWKQWGVFDQTAFDAFMASPAIALTTDATKKIITQEWLAFFPDGRQGWAIWRKTGLPELAPAPGANLAIPRRIPYGSNERNLNTNAYKQAAARYTVNSSENSYYGRVWWDKQ